MFLGACNSKHTKLLHQETVLYTEMFYIHSTTASSQYDLLSWNQINQGFYLMFLRLL